MNRLPFVLICLTATFFANAQNVGIGVTTPTAKLSISVNGTELTGTAAGNTLRTNAGTLGTTADSELSLANFGFLSSSNSSLGIKAYRTSAGTDWSTTALVFGYDVDNTVRAGGAHLALSANGNIGIGTVTPLQKLHVQGTTFLNGNVGIGISTPGFPLNFAHVLGDKISLFGNSGAHYGLGIQNFLMQIHSDASNSDIAFGYGSSSSFTERMRIKNAGETGIELNGRIVLRNGTSPLDIGYGPGIWLTKADNTGTLGFIGTQNNQNLGFYGGPGGWGFTYDAVNSRVGIGNPNPGYSLDVAGNLSIAGNFVNTSTVINSIGVQGSCSNTPGHGYGIIGEGGGVGVFGQATLAGAGNRSGFYGQGANGINNYGVFSIATGGTVAYGIYTSASGATTNYAGYFAGDVLVTGVFNNSDRKLKNDIKPLSNALSIINQLKPSVYTFKTNEYKQMNLPEGLQYGLIADEVQQVVPGAVKKAVQPAQYENHDEKKGKKLNDEVAFNAVNYTEIIPILIAGMKEQQVMIEELKMKNQKIDQQQQQINELLKEIKLIKEKLK